MLGLAAIPLALAGASMNGDLASSQQGFNPYLPLWEYIPDAEPRVFGDRLYVYGSHDRAGSDRFCDYQLRVWSAPVSNLFDWTDHGVSFSTRDVEGHADDVPWSDNELYAPDVVEKDGKYYLYAYIVGSPLAVAVSDVPTGPFELISQIRPPEGAPNDFGGWGQYADPGVLVECDAVHIYWGYQSSHYARLDPETMVDIVPGSYVAHPIPTEAPFDYFEACSPRKIGNIYYLLYAAGDRLVYATSDEPAGPFAYGGTIVTAGDYPSGNIHGGLVWLNGEWFVTYHRMTNRTVFSRRTCVERVFILEDGSIPQVETTSMGFSRGLNPFAVTPADVACVLRGGNWITEFDAATRAVVGNVAGSIAGYKTFDFGRAGLDLGFELELRSLAPGVEVEVWLDEVEGRGTKIGTLRCDQTEGEDWVIRATEIEPVSGRRDLYLRVLAPSTDEEALQIRSFRFVRS